jgi:hypothetical protein
MQSDQNLSETGDESQSTNDLPNEPPDDVIPAEVVEVLKELPPAQGQVVRSMFLAARMPSSSSASLAKRITPEHITQTLDNRDKENERDFRKSQSSELTKRIGMEAILILVLMVFGYAGITKEKDLAEKVIIAGISGLGGFGAGVALSKKDS